MESNRPPRYIHEIKPRNEEQKKLIEYMHRLWDWDMAIRQTRLYYDAFEVASPADTETYADNKEAFRGWEKITQEIRARDRSPDSPWCVTVFGTVGNGKTLISKAMVDTYNAIYCRYSGLSRASYVTQAGLIDDYKEDFDPAVIRRYSSKDLLVIDEIRVGRTDMSDYNRSVIQRILANRHAEKKKTILVGNILLSEVKDAFEEQMRSRLREGLTMFMKAPDMRERCRP